MEVKEFIDCYESLGSFPGVPCRRTALPWWERQGVNGVRGLGYRCGNVDGEADELGLKKDGWAGRGVAPCHRLVDNSKRRGLKGMKKATRRESVRG